MLIDDLYQQFQCYVEICYYDEEGFAKSEHGYEFVRLNEGR